MSVDRSLQDRFARASEENRRLEAEQSASALETGGDGGDSGGMDGLSERVARLEVRLDAIKENMAKVDVRLGEIDSRLRAVEVSVRSSGDKLDLLTAQVVAKLPSWWQMPAIFVSMVALLAALWAGYRYLAKLSLI